MLPSILGGHRCQMGGNPLGGESSLQGLPTEEGEGGEVLSSEGEPDIPAHQTFEEALCMVQSPGRLWQVTSPHWGVTTRSYSFSNVFQSIKTTQVNVLLHYTPNLCPKLTFLRLSLIFFSFICRCRGRWQSSRDMQHSWSERDSRS